MSMIELINQRVEEYNKKRVALDECRKETGALLKKDFASFVENVLRENKCPALEMRGWIPIFNDGDACTFQFSANEDGEEADALSECFEDVKFPLGDEHEAAMIKVSKYFNGMTDIIEEALGSYFKVVAGIDVDGNFHFNLEEDYDCGY